MSEPSIKDRINAALQLWIVALGVVAVTAAVVACIVQGFPVNEGFDGFFGRLGFLIAIIGGIAGLLKLAHVITPKVWLNVVIHALVLTATITSLMMASVKLEHIDTATMQDNPASD